MYRLTLTREERKAIDWVGYRYRHGDELYRLLWPLNHTPSEADWDADCEITFVVPEAIAWLIAGIIDEDLDCLSPAFAGKLIEWRSKIV